VTWLVENFLRLEMLQFVSFVEHIIGTNPSLFNLHFFSVCLNTNVVYWLPFKIVVFLDSAFKIDFTVHSSELRDKSFFTCNSMMGVKFIKGAQVNLVSKHEHLSCDRN
jgi:hypothetical protein